MEADDILHFNINKPDPSDIIARRAVDKPDYICHFGIDPTALHLYKKKGFKIVKTIDDYGVWNGLTVMQKDIRR